MSLYFVDHSFKKHEWMNSLTRGGLIKLMEEYERDFEVEAWTRDLIVHFLEVFNYIYPGGIKEHHIRCVATIIKQEGRDTNGKNDED